MITDVKGEIAQSTVARGSEGAKKYCRMLRDGTLAFADFMLVAELEGLVKIVNSSTTSTGIECAGAYDADGNDFGLNVPVGYTIMVIRVEVAVGLMTDDEDIEVLFMTSNTAFTTGTATVVTPVNKFGGAGGPGTGSQCGCSVAIAANGGTDLSTGARAYTFWRERLECGAKPAAAQNEPSTNTRLAWVAPRDGLPAVVAGAGSVGGHIETTTTGASETHITVEWIEMPTSWLT